MKLWHSTHDATRSPENPTKDQKVLVKVGTWPIEPGQKVWIKGQRTVRKGKPKSFSAECKWLQNEGANSFWSAEIGPFSSGEMVTYKILSSSVSDEQETGGFEFRVA